MTRIYLYTEAGVANPNPRKRKKQPLKIGHGGTLDSNASGVLGKYNQVSSSLLKHETNNKKQTNI